MFSKLLIVESPAKAKTIAKYVGSDYKVLASFGHVRELPKKNNSIDIKNDFAAKYQVIARNKKHVDEILAAAKAAKQVYLATDSDREGEAIAWHINELMLEAKIKVPTKRVTYNEITKQAVLDALTKARDIDFNLVDAQIARMTLDFLIGFNVSPLLWRKIKAGLSAGRVQSPALRLICERELEIQAFVVEDYFSVHLLSEKNKIEFDAKLMQYAGKKIAVRDIKTSEDAKKIIANLADEKTAKVTAVTKKQKKKNPMPPFITSSLQIEAARKFGYPADKIMRIAQGLYEGVNLGGESVGLITYMRTDSVQLSEIAISEIRQYVGDNFASTYLPKTANQYVSKSKNAQEAHEAIRPTSALKTPASIKQFLTPEQYKIYELIWQRAVASQMSSAVMDTVAVDLSVKNALFRVNGTSIAFNGYLVLYQEQLDDSINVNHDEKSQRLPEIINGESLPIKKFEVDQHSTEPKPRYTEASLVKALEELGVGRPSTYASIIATLKKRLYVDMDKKRFVPTETGAIVSKFLVEHLTRYVDFAFTAKMEDVLDGIAVGEEKKLPVLHKFWDELHAIVEEKKLISKQDVVTQALDKECPKCGKGLISKFGKHGRFVGCSGYPECNYMAKMDAEGVLTEIEPPEVIPDRKCPKDGGDLVIRTGRFGKFISCANYPKCKHIENTDTPNQDDEHAITCPECNKGKIVAKKGRFGLFYSCSNYPECKTIFKYQPVEDKCDECGSPVMMTHTTKTKGTRHICPKCKFEKKIIVD